MSQLRSHLPSLDVLRGLAILLVIAHNTQLLNPPELSGVVALAQYALNIGWVGVQLFFVLSGFLITGILLDELGRPNGMRNFLVRRALRIFPLYYGFLLLVFVVLPALGIQPEIYRRDSHNQTWLWTYLSDWTSPLGIGPHSLPHFWSLAVEEQFYLVWPLVVLALRTPAKVAQACVAVALVSLLCRIALLQTDLPAEVLYEWPLCRMDALALGGLAAACWRHPHWAQWVRHRASAILCVTVAGFAAVFVWTHGLPRLSPRGVTAGYTGLALLFMVAVYWLAWRDTERADEARAWTASAPARLLQSVGKYSYGMYVFHKPMHDLFSAPLLARLGVSHIGSIGPACLHVLGVALAAYVSAWLSYHLYEVHFLRLKNRFT